MPRTKQLPMATRKCKYCGYELGVLLQATGYPTLAWCTCKWSKPLRPMKVVGQENKSEEMEEHLQ